MVVIDKEKCVGCGLCVRICHEQCIIPIIGNGNKVEKIDHSLCSTCTQCIAACPQQALSWNQAPSQHYDSTRLPSAEQLDELLKQRRTVRHFRKRKIDRALVEEIAGYGVYAPTNNYDMRMLAVDDPEIIKELDTYVMRFIFLFFTLCYRSRLVFNLIRRIAPEISPKNRVKMKRGLDRGYTYDSLHTTTIFIVGDRRILLSEASAQYAIYNMILSAQVMGIGSRINAALTVTLDRSRRARKRLGLAKHEHILAALELGYPAVKFSNKVEGKTMNLHWYGRW